MKSLNSITTIGNLAKDVELKTSKSGAPVAILSLASTNSKNGTNFYTVYVYGTFAETCAKYLKKGSKVCVQGELNVTVYKKDDKVSTYINIDTKEIYFLSSFEEVGKEGNSILTAKAPETGEDLPF